MKMLDQIQLQITRRGDASQLRWNEHENDRVKILPLWIQVVMISTASASMMMQM